ncbi:ribbon-helix-helix domain-containing protein [Methylocapsa sp. S129]|uniref:ribbon-helix-helix domain-containing protein n=1 Tax=Methylocapsa sp. S129 TaxID=1641869 RepID=UPI00352ABAD0
MSRPLVKGTQTRATTRQISGHYAAAEVHAFRILAAELDMDVQELLAEALNVTFTRHGHPNRIAITSGRRKKRDA